MMGEIIDMLCPYGGTVLDLFSGRWLQLLQHRHRNEMLVNRKGRRLLHGSIGKDCSILPVLNHTSLSRNMRKVTDKQINHASHHVPVLSDTDVHVRSDTDVLQRSDTDVNADNCIDENCFRLTEQTSICDETDKTWSPQPFENTKGTNNYTQRMWRSFRSKSDAFDESLCLNMAPLGSGKSTTTPTPRLKNKRPKKQSSKTVILDHNVPLSMQTLKVGTARLKEGEEMSLCTRLLLKHLESGPGQEIVAITKLQIVHYPKLHSYLYHFPRP